MAFLYLMITITPCIFLMGTMSDKRKKKYKILRILAWIWISSILFYGWWESINDPNSLLVRKMHGEF